MSKVPFNPQAKATRWSITMWLNDNTGYTHDSPQILQQTFPQEWSLEGQEEKGKDSGKLHYQLFLKTPHVRGSAVQKVFPKCHIEIARNPFALEQYVHKEDTRVGEFKAIETKSPQWHIVISHFFKWFHQKYPNYPSSDPSDEFKLREWDEFIIESIIDGMRIDILGVNPQYRSCVVKYWRGYLARFQLSVGQTDSQTDENIVAPICIPKCLPLASPPLGAVQSVVSSECDTSASDLESSVVSTTPPPCSRKRTVILRRVMITS